MTFLLKRRPCILMMKFAREYTSLKQLHPDYQFDTDLTSKNLEIKMKPHQFEQLFLIFIDNAIKYDVKNKKIKVKTRLKNKQK